MKLKLTTMYVADTNAKWKFLLFPAVTMMLGWGLRGHIGGGPFGAMIPGALVTMILCLLLEIPATLSAIITVFGVAAIGIGGEMTYGQTLGFLRVPDTMWWGILGITLKGAVWGLVGGTILAVGFLHQRLKAKTVTIAFLWMFLGMLIGFKLINHPMVIYFSDPLNPRSESWAALLLGVLFMLIFLRIKIKKDEWTFVSRFAGWGAIGGGLGFGLGGFWIVLGSHLENVIFRSWWKAMEFTFGFLFGAALGYASWLNRQWIFSQINKQEVHQPLGAIIIFLDLVVVLAIGLIMYWFVPYTLEPFVEAANEQDGFLMMALRSLALIPINYAFYAFLLILASIRFPSAAWFLAVTLTFSHAAIDLVRDYFPDNQSGSLVLIRFLLVVLVSLGVAFLSVYFQNRKKVVQANFLLLVWACILISMLRLTVSSEQLTVEGMSVSEIVFGKYFVDLFFLFMAIVVTRFAMGLQKAKRPAMKVNEA